MREWLRACKKQFVFAGIIFLIATLSFGIGYLANTQFNHAPIIIEKCGEDQIK